MKINRLEFIRGITAAIVLLYHAAHSYHWFSKVFDLQTFGTDSVMIFFILSGCVINISQSNCPRTRGAFIHNRLARLLPQFIVGVGLGVLSFRLTDGQWPTWGVVLGNFFMVSSLQGYIVQSLESCATVWSLSFEMFFYLMFALSIGSHQKTILRAWFFVSMLVLPFYFFKTQIGPVDHVVALFSFSPVWLIGYYVYEYRHRFSVDEYGALLSLGALAIVSRITFIIAYHDPLRYFFFAIAAIPLFRYCLQSPASEGTKKWNNAGLFSIYVLLVATIFLHSHGQIITRILSSLLPLGLIFVFWLIRNSWVKDKLATGANRLGAVLGRYSYALYLVHLPFLYFFSKRMADRPLLSVLLFLSRTVLFTWLLESWYQPAINNLLKRNPAWAIQPALVKKK